MSLGEGLLYLFKVHRLSNELDRRKFMYTDTWKKKPPREILPVHLPPASSSFYFDDNSIVQACVPNLAIVSDHLPPSYLPTVSVLYMQSVLQATDTACS